MVSLCGIAILLAVAVGAPPAAKPATASGLFAAAFDFEAVDLAGTKQTQDGKEVPLAGEQLKRTLGLTANEGDFEKDRLELGATAPVAPVRSAYELVLTLKAATAIGSVGVTPADGRDKGSVNEGELWYLKADAPMPPDPKNAAQWVAVNFGEAQPFLRFATLPPGTSTRAFLYRDVRSEGRPALDYLHFYKGRMENLTLSADPYCEGGVFGSGADSLVEGKFWQNYWPEDGRAARVKISEKNPTWVVLSWDRPRKLEGIFLRSNAEKFTIQAYRGEANMNPSIAPAKAWQKVEGISERATKHTTGNNQWFQNHWITFPAIETQAIRVEITEVQGNYGWIHGLAAMGNLNDAPVVAFKRDIAHPYRVKAEIPFDGEAALAIEDASGKRIRNLAANMPVTKGATGLSWDLRDESGKLVGPGAYRLRGVVAPPLELIYQTTPYPNVQNFFPDRTPWMTNHQGPNGWLSDHSNNWAAASVGEHVYFGASMAEAGVSLIDCDLKGKKNWAKHGFGAWTGVSLMAASSEALFIHASDHKIYRMDPATREPIQIGTSNGPPGRRGNLTAMAANKDYVFLSFGGEPLFDNPSGGNNVDFANCTPKSGSELLSVIRMGGNPPGEKMDPRSSKPQGTGNLYLESSFGPGPRQYSIISFIKPVPIGSVVFPHTKGLKFKMSVLKPGATYPPDAEKESDWIAIEDKLPDGRWKTLTVPENTMTRAFRIQFTSNFDEFDEDKWFGRLDGLRLLNRRFKDLAPTAKIRVNSGKVNEFGEWDAQRKESLGMENPGIYVMEWDKPERVDGLAIKEIDGALTEIDAWVGDGPVTLDGANWKKVASYKQERRKADYHPGDNYQARYMDGYVEMRPDDQPGHVVTKAIRLRVVEQWYNSLDGACRRMDGIVEHGTHLSQSAIMKLDTRWCRIMGVSPLQAVGGDPKRDSLEFKRLEVRDAQTCKLVKEFPLALGWVGMGTSANGDLYSINENHSGMVKINTTTGEAATIVPNIRPSRAALGPDGSMYIFTWGEKGDPKARIVEMYDSSGKFVRTFGKGGGISPGMWDPEKFGNVNTMCADKDGSLWVVESDYYPRRILQYNIKTGALVKEILGNTAYGGGGTLSRIYANRMYLGPIEFEFDAKTNTSHIRNKLAEGFQGDVVDRQIGGHDYLVTAPTGNSDRQDLAVIYLKDDAKGTARPVAAFGDADGYWPLRASAIITPLDGRAPKDFRFIWADRNGDGKPQYEEVQFEPRVAVGSIASFGEQSNIGYPDEKLGFLARGAYYSVKEILPNGTPVYQRTAFTTPQPGATLKLNNGNVLSLHSNAPETQRDENFGLDPQGKKLWGYPSSSPGVSGLYIAPWWPGNVTNEFGVVGHETSTGELGEFVVVHSNTGAWRIWSADGFLAGMLTLHKGDSRARFLSFPQAAPGMRLDPITLSQEHFHGFFTRNDVDKKYYAVMGFNHATIVEVRGIDQIRRLSAEFTLTAEDLAQTLDWEARRAKRMVESRALFVQASLLDEPPTIDGLRRKEEWGKPSAAMGQQQEINFTLAYDAVNLYVCWNGKGQLPIKNAGGEFQRLFKTGAAVDLLLSTDPAADPKRNKPAKGDIRILITSVKDKPVAVLYQQVADNVKPEEAWRAYTPTGGENKFARVVRLEDANIAISGADGFTVEAAIPLSEIGLKPKAGMRLKLDWGILTSDDGNQVKQRMYWANPTATGTSDESVESRLEPHLWGNLGF